MVEAMNSIAKLGVELTGDERNLLSLGYKNMLGAKRASWRKLSEIKSKEEASGNTEHVGLLNASLKKVEDELTAKCNEILLTIDDYLLPLSKTGEAAVFYHKMKDDYFRYLAEYTSDANRQEATSQSLKAYEAAKAIAESDLPPSNPVRLGLALNFSIFHHEIMANTERACNMAKQALEDAAAELHSLDQKSYQDSSVILKLIADNLTLWTPYLAEGEGQGAQPTNGNTDEERWSIERVHLFILQSVVSLCLIKDSLATEIEKSGKDLENLNSKAMFLFVPDMASHFKVVTAFAVGTGTFLAFALSSKKWPERFSWPMRMSAFVYALGWISQGILFLFYIMIKYSWYMLKDEQEEVIDWACYT